MPSSSDKMPFMEPNEIQENLHGRWQPHDHLSFRTASSSSDSGLALRQENPVDRQWGGGNSASKSRTTSPQLKAQSDSSLNPMMQRWQGESNQDQPFNNVGRFSTIREADNKQKSDGHV